MNNSRPSTTKPSLQFHLLATATLLVAGLELASSWPRLQIIAHEQSNRFAHQAGQTSDRGEAALKFRLAAWLDPNNPSTQLSLAQLDLAAGQPDQALKRLAQVGEGTNPNSQSATQLRIRTLLELGRYSQAADTATDWMTTTHPQSDSDLVLAGLVYALADRTSDLTNLLASTTSPQAAQSLRRAQTGGILLAAELYATGLPNSSSALLIKQPPSYIRNLLLARLRYSRHTLADLNQAASYLITALRLNPSGLQAHQLLARVYRDQNKLPAASEQDILITKLQAGRP